MVYAKKNKDGLIALYVDEECKIIATILYIRTIADENGNLKIKLLR